MLASADAADIVVDIHELPAPAANLYAWGAGWKGWVGHSPAEFHRDDNNPCCLGPYFAASMVAAEVFKISRGLRKGRFASNDAYSLWNGEVGGWDKLPDGPSVQGQALPSCYLIGAGAVGQGVVQILGASGLAEAYLVTIDHDNHDEKGTNLNRCFLAGIGDLRQPKVEAVTRFRALTGLAGYEFHGKLTDYLVSSRSGLRPDLAQAESSDLYELVISAVDLDQSRQDIQGLNPRIVIGGSTDGLRAQSASYGIVSNAECLGCWNIPGDKKGRTTTIEAELRNLSAEERRQRLSREVENLEHVLSYLATTEPRCGQLGASDLHSFVTSVEAEFSVSFVSMAAAIMTVVRLFKVTPWGNPGASQMAKSVFQFKNLQSAEVTTPPRSGCGHCYKSVPL